MDDKRPLRPQDSERLGITDSVWDMMITCWDKKDSARHQIENVIACLTRAAREWAADIPAFLLASEAGIAQVMDLKGEDAEEFVDKLYKVAPLGLRTLTADAYVQGRLWPRPRLTHRLGRHIFPG